MSNKDIIDNLIAGGSILLDYIDGKSDNRLNNILYAQIQLELEDTVWQIYWLKGDDATDIDDIVSEIAAFKIRNNKNEG